MTIIIAILCYEYVDDNDERWYAISALVGGISSIIACTLSAYCVT